VLVDELKLRNGQKREEERLQKKVSRMKQDVETSVAAKEG